MTLESHALTTVPQVPYSARGKMLYILGLYFIPRRASHCESTALHASCFMRDYQPKKNTIVPLSGSGNTRPLPFTHINILGAFAGTSVENSPVHRHVVHLLKKSVEDSSVEGIYVIAADVYSMQ